MEDQIIYPRRAPPGSPKMGDPISSPKVTMEIVNNCVEVEHKEDEICCSVDATDQCYLGKNSPTMNKNSKEQKVSAVVTTIPLKKKQQQQQQRMRKHRSSCSSDSSGFESLQRETVASKNHVYGFTEQQEKERRSAESMRARKVGEKQAREFYNRQVDKTRETAQHLARMKHKEEIETCTFHPVISEKSQELAFKHYQYVPSEPLTRAELEEELLGSTSSGSTSETSSSSPRKLVNFKEFLDRSNAHQERVSQKIEDCKKELEQKESEMCTFQPNIGQKKISYPSHGQNEKPGGVFNELYIQAFAKRAYREQVVEENMEMREIQELEGCTFQPVINRTSEKLAQALSPRRNHSRRKQQQQDQGEVQLIDTSCDSYMSHYLDRKYYKKKKRHECLIGQIREKRRQHEKDMNEKNEDDLATRFSNKTHIQYSELIKSIRQLNTVLTKNK